MAETDIAAVVRDNLLHHNGGLYELLAWCIMPNHVHILIQPLERVTKSAELNFSDEANDVNSPLSRIMHSLKSYTANKANAILGRSGNFWQRESYDHWVRDIDELERIIKYIALNPVKAGLCERPIDWAFSSAHDRFLIDGSDCAMVGKLRDDWKR